MLLLIYLLRLPLSNIILSNIKKWRWTSFFSSKVRFLILLGIYLCITSDESNIILIVARQNMSGEIFTTDTLYKLCPTKVFDSTFLTQTLSTK